MNKNPARRLLTVGALACIATLGLPTASAVASSAAQHGSATLFNPVLTGPAPYVPANCPFANGDLGLNFTSGNAVSYGTQNANGQWGGANGEGVGVFSVDGTPMYQGHLHVWFGDGNNAGAQSEMGFTLDFLGSGADGTLTIHVNQHVTTNNGGVMSASVTNIKITCS